jgi:hypothetical protein
MDSHDIIYLNRIDSMAVTALFRPDAGGER